MTWWDGSNTTAVDVETGCFMLVRQEAVEQVGPMGEKFFIYGEETDSYYRFKQAGWKMLFAPEAETLHLHGQSSKQARVEMLVQLRLSILQFIKNHYGWLTHKMACFFAV